MKILAKWYFFVFCILDLQAAFAAGFSEMQLPYGSASDVALGLPKDLSAYYESRKLSREIPGKRIPDQGLFRPGVA
jgi:hypothetical protein